MAIWHILFVMVRRLQILIRTSSKWVLTKMGPNQMKMTSYIKLIKMKRIHGEFLNENVKGQQGQSRVQSTLDPYFGPLMYYTILAQCTQSQTNCFLALVSKFSVATVYQNCHSPGSNLLSSYTSISSWAILICAILLLRLLGMYEGCCIVMFTGTQSMG